MSLTGLTLGLEFVAYAGIAVLMIVIVTSSRVSTRIVLGLSFKNFFPRKRLTRGRFRFKSSGHRRDAPITGMVSVFPFYDGQPPFVPTVAVCLAKAYIKPEDGIVIPYGIYPGDTMIGFFAITHDMIHPTVSELTGFRLTRAFRGWDTGGLLWPKLSPCCEDCIQGATIKILYG